MPTDMPPWILEQKTERAVMSRGDAVVAVSAVERMIRLTNVLGGWCEIAIADKELFERLKIGEFVTMELGTIDTERAHG